MAGAADDEFISQFTPIRFAFTNKLNRDDKLLLVFDALACIIHDGS